MNTLKFVDGHLHDLALAQIALNCPLFSNEAHRNNPYLLIESFFQYTTPFGYRKHLLLWFRYALNEDTCHPKAIELVFLYKQYQNLLNAGYLIAVGDITYIPEPTSPSNKLFGHWLLEVSTKHSMGYQAIVNHEIHLLGDEERNNPMAFLKQALNLKAVVNLRFGLKEWFEAALTENDSIASLDKEYLFDMFETLQKITEALYLIIVPPFLFENDKKY